MAGWETAHRNMPYIRQGELVYRAALDGFTYEAEQWRDPVQGSHCMNLGSIPR